MNRQIICQTLIFAFVLLAGGAPARATSGTWTNNASSVWSDPTNWLAGTVADGTDSIADFTTLDILADRTVTLDSSRNIGALAFGDVSGAQNWFLNASGGSVLTLAVSSASPTIAVTNNTATVSLPLAGTSGLTKAGSGTLILGNTNNTYSGPTTINGGTLQLTNAPSTGPLLYMSFDNVSGSTVINDGSMGAAANGLIVGTNVSIVAGGRYGNALQVGAGAVTTGGVFINNAVTLFNNTNNTTVNAWTVAMWVKTTTTTNGGLLYQGGNTWASGNTRFYTAGNVNDAGGPYFGGVRNSQAWEVGQIPINDGNWHFVAMTTASPGNVKKIYVDGVLDNFSATPNDNGWTNNATGNQVWIGGAPNISDNNVGLNGMVDEVYIYNRALSQLEVTNLLNTSSTPAPGRILPAATAVLVAGGAKLDLNGINSTITGLTGSGTVDTTLTNAGAPPLTPTLTINNSSDTTYPGVIANTAGILTVMKTGAGALTLASASGYTGNTILNSGTLNINATSAIGIAGTLMINGGTIDNTSGASVTVINNKPETWSGDFTFTGTTNLSFGTGAVTLGGPGTSRVVTVSSNTLTVGVLNGNFGPGYGLTKVGAGTLFLGGASASALGGPLIINGGKVQMSQDINAATGLTGTGTIETPAGVNKWFFINNTADWTFSGTFQNGGGSLARGLGLNKNGPGTLTMNGTVTFNDTLTLNAGTVSLVGTGVVRSNSATADVIGATANNKAVLQISGGASFLDNFNSGQPFNNSIGIGTVANARGAIQMSSGTILCNRQLAIGSAGYGAFTQTGGSTTIGGFIALGGNATGGIMNLSGGTLLMTGSSATIGYAATTTFGVMNLSGNAVFNMTGAGNGVWPGEVGTGTLNVFGNAALTITNSGLVCGRGNAAGNGIINVLGGTTTVNSVSRGSGSGTINFNGGTLKANQANAAFVAGLNANYVYSGGAVIDDGGFAIAVDALAAPGGYGVASIPITSAGSNYFDTPIVTIVNISASGSGATAIAQIDYAAGTITNVVVTCPGHDYGSGDVLGVNLAGGGGSGAVMGAPVLAANVSGGLTKLGAGSLTLSGGYAYTGNTLVNNGTLNLNPATGTPTTPGSLTINNAGLTLDLTSGIPLPASSMALQNNATLTFNYGALSVNPSTPAINVAGGLTTAGASITLNVSALGLKNGQFTLIKYTGTPLADLSNFTLVLPPGVVATLVNNTGNVSIDLNITLSPKFLTWFGAGNSDWDIITTVNWKDGGVDTVYQQYTNGSVVVGDAVLFDDTLTNDFINPQPTNVNLTTAISSFPVILNNSDPYPYSFTGLGSIVGGGYLVKSNTGSLTIGTSNSFSGGTFIYGGSVIITNDVALGVSASKVNLGGGNLQVNASTTNATRAVSVSAASTIAVGTNAIYQLGGVVNGSGGLTKIESGTLILTGSNGLTGNLNVRQGALRSTGTEVLPGVVRVGNTAGMDGVLNVTAGNFQAVNNGGQFASGLIAGAVAGSGGDITLSGGTLIVQQQLGLGAGVGGYGAFSMSGGTLACGSYIVVGFNNDRAVYNQSAGTTTISSNLMTIAAGGSGAIGVANISGGTFTSSFGASSGIMVGERGMGTLNLSGAAAINVPTNAGLTIGPVANQTGWNGTLNLNGGTITANRVARGLGTGAARINLNGGTLKASTANPNFLTGLDSATVYSNGVTVDDGGFSITIAQSLQKPTDYGVSSITLSSGGSGYIDTPIVTITGGIGSNATATATVSGGVVTAVTVTCPGTGYGSGDGLSVTFDGGGAAVTPAVANTPVLTANVSGGVVKKGAGTLNLTGANTYTSTTAVTAGTLLMTPAQNIGPVTVASNTTFGVLVNNAGAATVGRMTLGSTTLDKTTLLFSLVTGTNPISPVLQTGTLTLNGTNTIRLSGTVTAGTIPILQYTGALAGSGSFNTNVVVPQGQLGTLSNYIAGSTLYVIVSGSPGIVWTGTNAAPALTNVWNLNSAINWLAAGIPTFYQETAPPGDPVTFNDIGNSLVLLSNTASPASITISNNAVNYAFRGTGRLSGSAGLTKLGSGTATISLAGNDYTGNTTVTGGTLQLGTGTTLPDGAGSGNVTINSPGTLDLNNVSETINGLAGTGTINNSGGAAVVLTMGNGNGPVAWGGSILNTGSGGASIIKVGTGNSVITGTNYLTSTAASQINGGTMIITNGGALFMSGGAEFWVQQNAGTATVIVDGGLLVTSNNWMVVGRNNVAANGTMIVNHGTVQKAGNNNFVVGSLGATGTLIVNGGQVLNNGNLWLGENTGANAYLYLNGGLVQATQVRANGTTPATSIAYFNGGTLQATASNTNFLQVISMVMSNGLVLDDNGFTLSIGGAAFQDGDGLGGGLLKKGSGTVYLDQGNSYSGTTVVTNGTLAGVGSISGPVVVAPAGNLGAGDAGATAGTLAINNNLTLQGKVSMRINRDGSPTSDLVAGVANITYGGALVISNQSTTALTTSDTFQLFNVAGSISGNFSSIVGSPGPGLAYQFTPASGVLSIVTGIASNPTNITFSVSGSTLSLSWPADHLGWILQSQTNSVTVGLSNNWFDVPGSESVTGVSYTINPANGAVFYRLRHP